MKRRLASSPKGNPPMRKKGTGSNFAAFAKLRACTVLARSQIILLEINGALR